MKHPPIISLALLLALGCDSSASTTEEDTVLDSASVEDATAEDTAAEIEDAVTPQPERLVDCDFPDLDTWEATCNASDCSSSCCVLGCGSGGPSGGCPALCMAAGCASLASDQCPDGPCQRMTDCAGDERCYPLFSTGPPACGDVSSYRQDVACCEGLEKRCGVVTAEGTCDMEAGGYQGFAQCLACGDGRCDETFENACSCPEDCAQ